MCNEKQIKKTTAQKAPIQRVVVLNIFGEISFVFIFEMLKGARDLPINLSANKKANPTINIGKKPSALT